MGDAEWTTRETLALLNYSEQAQHDLTFQHCQEYGSLSIYKLRLTLTQFMSL